MSFIDCEYPLIIIDQCIAKTSKEKRCTKKPILGHFLCQQHHKIVSNFSGNVRRIKQQGGDPITDIYKSMLFVALPSCIDILQCDWITDVTSVIPGLPLILRLMSY